LVPSDFLLSNAVPTANWYLDQPINNQFEQPARVEHEAQKLLTYRGDAAGGAIAASQCFPADGSSSPVACASASAIKSAPYPTFVGQVRVILEEDVAGASTECRVRVTVNNQATANKANDKYPTTGKDFIYGGVGLRDSGNSEFWNVNDYVATSLPIKVEIRPPAAGNGSGTLCEAGSACTCNLKKVRVEVDHLPSSNAALAAMKGREAVVHPEALLGESDDSLVPLDTRQCLAAGDEPLAVDKDVRLCPNVAGFIRKGVLSEPGTPTWRTLHVRADSIQPGDADHYLTPGGAAVASAGADVFHLASFGVDTTKPLTIGRWRIRLGPESANLTSGESYIYKLYGCVTPAAGIANVAATCTAVYTFDAASGKTVYDGQGVTPDGGSCTSSCTTAAGFAFDSLVIAADDGDITDAATTATMDFELEVEVLN
jgi:hypothetical protein